MSRRGPRAWLGLWIVLMLCATYIAGWVFYATMHQTAVGVQLPPGVSAVTGDGVEIRILAMHQSREVSGEYATKSASPGATFIITTFEATVPEPESFCHMELLGRDGKKWEYTTKASVGRPASFSCHEFAPGVPTRGEIMFEIPQTEADHLMGIRLTFETDRLYRSKVLRPGEPR
ncbi:hypothetical protein [Granulicoccus sp. GXG6511]|uniref:hypothetical protein n=1 Tax=Granulicoccus sp. GXG6511 TaxID=3381351 RepID=UPI003D7CFD54